jgi:hypothetical protein
MSKWVRESENLLFASDPSRQPELSLTTNLCADSQPCCNAQDVVFLDLPSYLSFPTILPTLLDLSS